MKRSAQPLISVVIPFYNEAARLHDMLNGLRAQTFTDFEAILIDDASTDHGADIICSYDDERFVLIQQKKNKKNPACRNIGIAASKAKYIAVHDADDIAHPRRLEQQLAFMEMHADIDVCGSYIHDFYPDGTEQPIFRKTTHTLIMAESLFRIPVIHTTCLMRRAIFENRQHLYDEKQDGGLDCKDYDLFNRLLVDGKKFINVPFFLMKKRVHGSSQTFSTPFSLNFSGNAHARRHLFNALCLDDQKMIYCHNRLCDWLEWPDAVDKGFLEDFPFKKWFQEITMANDKAGLFDPAAIEEILEETSATIKNRTQAMPIAHDSL